jgi:hypothetical protein
MSENCNTNVRPNVMKNSPKDKDVQAVLAEINNAPACKTASALAHVETPIASGTAAATVSVSCEMVSVMVDQLVSNRKNIACTIKNRQKGADTNIALGATINFRNGRYGVIECPNGFRLSNVVQGMFTITNQLTSDDTYAIKNEVKESILTKLDAAQKSTTDAATTATSQRSYQIAKKELNEFFENSNVDQEISSIVFNASLSGGINIVNEGRLSAGECVISNSIILDLVVSNIIGSVSASAVENTSIREVITDLKNRQESESKLPSGSAIAAIVGVILLLVVGYYAWKNRDKIKALVGA